MQGTGQTVPAAHGATPSNHPGVAAHVVMTESGDRSLRSNLRQLIGAECRTLTARRLSGVNRPGWDHSRAESESSDPDPNRHTIHERHTHHWQGWSSAAAA